MTRWDSGGAQGDRNGNRNGDGNLNGNGNWKWEWEWTLELIHILFSCEGGGALPEDTSCEGCGVGTPETRRAAAR